ncbi:MAG: hypothetical protein HYS17_01440 [Micavibrio aeruginosavorus]|uniref:Uncharacterized protein n=1 Tax=Micavibrio aeruginosavorus TaxID=349221 RepID=A0A7T5UIA6_9BACT|nr:MAG: hypothetical protein HYS17_01440 [Micavibrio aeruginosavorus]
MAPHPFLASLGFTEDADLDAVERRFLEVVKDQVQKVSFNYEEEDVRQEEAALRDLHGRFFQYTVQWILQEGRAHTGTPVPEATKLRKQARAVLEDLQRHMTEFSCCYMHINRFMTLLRDEIRQEETRLAGHVATGVKWTSDAGPVIARYKQQKKTALETCQRMQQARAVLEDLEPDFQKIHQGIIRMYGGDKVEALQRPLTAALRMREFKRARGAVATILETPRKFGVDQKTAEQVSDDVRQAASRLIDQCEKHQDLLASDEGRLYLKPIETDQSYNAQVRELRKIKAFLGKYYMPYMQFKLDMLMHLKDKLLVNGSVESLMTLYKRMITGMARPMNDIKTLRLYEGEVLDRVQYLLGGQFQEVPVILARAEETVKEFRSGAEEFRDIENLEVAEIESGLSNQDAPATSGIM